MWLLLACQSPPSTPEVVIDPAEPTGADTLTALLVEESVDPQGDYLSYRYVWYRDETLMGGLSGPEVIPDHTGKGEHWEVRVIASDGFSDATPATDEVVIGNQPPELSLTLPEVQGSGFALVVVADASDADGDDVLVEASWTVDGVDAGVSALEVPALLLEVGQEWTVVARASDGESWTEETGTVTVDDAQPVVDSVLLSPENATVEDTFTVVAEVVDEDDTTLVIDWYANGALHLSDGGDTLSAEDFAKYDQVSVSVTASDALQASEARSSNVVTIENSPPVAPGIAFSPPEPHAAHDDLVCVVDVDATDSDDDELSLEFHWEVEGVEVSGDTTYQSGDTVDGDSLFEDAVWTCFVEVSDGQATAGAEAVVEVSWACDASRGWSGGELTGETGLGGLAEDIDGDGYVDLVVCDAADDLVVYWGDGSGGYGADFSSTHLGDGSACVGIGDLSGDGNDDLVTIDDEAGLMVTLVHNGSRTWNRVHAEFDDDATDVELADVDLDGRDDLVYTSEELGCMAVRLGLGGTSVGDASCLISQTGPFELGDLDGDGLVEVVQVAEGDLKVYEFDGSSAELGIYTVLPSPELDPEGVDLADGDGDGDLDILAWGTWDGDVVLAVYLNDGDGDPSTSFSECGVGFLDSSPVAAADLDGDGVPDAFRIDGSSYQYELSR